MVLRNASAMAAALASEAPRCGWGVRLAAAGVVDVSLTTEARRRMGSAASAAAWRAAMGRLRGGLREIATGGAEWGKHVREWMSVGTGKRCDECITCSTGARERQVHVRHTCQGYEAGRRLVARTVGEELAGWGWSLWFDVSRRVGHFTGETIKGGWPGESARGYGGGGGEERIVLEVPEWEGLGKNTMTETRGKCLWAKWKANGNDAGRFWGDAVRAARYAIMGTKTERLGIVRQMAPAVRAWILQNVLGGEGGEALQTALTFTEGLFECPPCMVGTHGEGMEDRNWKVGKLDDLEDPE